MEIIRSDAAKKITGITQQIKNADRVNVAVDGRYAFSLTVGQVVDLGLKIGQEVDEAKLAELENASEFGKVYQRALEYALMRPRSVREVKDYLWRKGLDKKLADGRIKKGVDPEMAEKILDKLISAGYLDDKRFAEFWVENRMQKKGISERRLRMELMKKGVDSGIIEEVFSRSARSDAEEIQKIILKKRRRYTDEKLVAYLVGQGFGYHEAKEAMEKRGET